MRKYVMSYRLILQSQMRLAVRICKQNNSAEEPNLLYREVSTM